jgi:hypothetical protein
MGEFWKLLSFSQEQEEKSFRIGTFIVLIYCERIFALFFLAKNLNIEKHAQ